ncbi:hypothetical protein [Glycomyces dulcitolivorans]|jgi:hypothetical protein|uniref:hypothetical protein n=1 Tax=Glycomyces dulcitolivorans TaxID=2200759 RepID=UPI000DD4DDE6|nr:hypothetical protein [Glycomyces dulcitolivorans]
MVVGLVEQGEHVESAVQADYLARRIAIHDLAGTAGHAANRIGLEDARRRLTREQPGSDDATAR